MSKIEKRPMKAYVRFDGTGRIVPSSLILRRKKPKVGKWMEVPAYECCNPTTTTTTTTSCPSTIQFGYYDFCGGGGQVTGLSINGVPVTVTSGSFPLSTYGSIIEATTNQSGNVTVEVSYTGAGSFSRIEIFGCGAPSYSANYIDGSGTLAVESIINCECLSVRNPNDGFNMNILTSCAD